MVCGARGGRVSRVGRWVSYLGRGEERRGGEEYMNIPTALYLSRATDARYRGTFARIGEDSPE